MVNNYCIEDYIEIISMLNNEYFNFQKEWCRKFSYKMQRINFKNKCIKHIYDVKNNELDSKFLELIRRYYDLIEDFHLEIKVKLSKIRVESRIKEFESLLNKIHQKSCNDGGNYPINKIVNDVLGFRLIDINYSNNIEEIYRYIDSEDELIDMNRIKVIKRDIIKKKSYYKGTHIYFRGYNNYCIPIELQIWDKKNEKMNRESHKKHKQRYIDTIEGYRLLNVRKEV